MQRNLLDTHALIWFLNGDNQLSAKARQAIEKKNAANFVSIASLWEISIKISLGKLELNAPYKSLQNELLKNGFDILSITFEDTLTLASLPFHHRDPFDRIIISQAINNNLSILSTDQYFGLYQPQIIW